ncbi:hypothetical protein [Streptomyces sp. CB01580]|uniref:hypothetical protein n=1 Tax=Streptomyces sp. CB01580 TaxID=1703933 RepID=UPI000D1A9641|nr:hypothetical protein [Streptomyces sp. CB01580]
MRSALVAPGGSWYASGDRATRGPTRAPTAIHDGAAPDIRPRYGRRPVDHFPGGIKDVMVFDRALTEAEISGLLRP